MTTSMITAPLRWIFKSFGSSTTDKDHQQQNIPMAIDWQEHLKHLLFEKADDETKDEAEKVDSHKYATVLLNHCFDSPKLEYRLDESVLKNEKIVKFIQIWNNATVRHTVDGGSNYLYDLQLHLQLKQSVKIDDRMWPKNPDIITGDFDSIRTDVLQHYKHLKPNQDTIKSLDSPADAPVVRVVETPDQSHTDFTKAIQELAFVEQTDHHTLINRTKIDSIVVFYSTTGRLDQMLSIYSTLYQFSYAVRTGQMPPLILVDLGNSISILLGKGKHHIPVIKSARWCSLIPLAGPVTLSTTGFRWNLNNDTLAFGRFISTSQEFDNDFQIATVEIFNDNALLFTFDYRHVD